MNKILFVTYGGGHVNIIRHIYKALYNKDLEIQVIGLTSSVKILDRDGIPHKKISDYISIFDNSEEIIRHGEELAKLNYDKNSGLDYNDIVAYLGFSFYDLISYEGSYEKAYDIFSKYGRKIFNPINTMEKIIKLENPDVVVLTSSMRMEKAAGIVANSLGIPVVRILDKLCDKNIIPYKCKACVMNEKAKSNLLKNNNIEKKDIIVTGQPDFEDSLKLHSDKLDIIMKELQVNKYKKIISFMSQPSQLDIEKIVEGLFEISNKNHDYLYIIKIHPNENVEDYFKILKEKISYNLKIVKYEAQYIVAISDVILTKYSTVGLLAALMGKPLIKLNILNEKYSIDYSEYGIAYEVSNFIDLEDKISKLIDINSIESQKLKHAREELKNERNAANNIAHVIRESVKI
ncbi:hypothetical protein [Sedimentibacter sp.]|uniref:hypothetical protein n=1 Tax=Sedimentibacter sp. TaxID=1960295 RepID=UPI0028A11A56|nr:hypothetical protein [Sedimentibacter sp.]